MVRQHIADRVKVRYPEDLKGLRNTIHLLQHELSHLENAVLEAESKRGGVANITNENRISSAYRSLMKKIGVIQALQESGVHNPIGR